MNTLSTRICPDIGAWRAWLDHASASPDCDAHAETCPACQQLVAELREDSLTARDALATLAPSRLPTAAEVTLARQRLGAHQASAAPAPADRQPPAETLATAPADRQARAETVATADRQPPAEIARPRFPQRLSTPWRIASTAVAAAVALTFFIAFTPQGGSAAAAFLAQFRSQQVTAINVSEDQGQIYRTLNSLSNLGTVQTPNAMNGTGASAVVRAAEGRSATVSLAEAAQSVGFQLRTPDPALLPADLSKTPQVRVITGSQIRFTFDKKKAQAYFQSTGHPEVSLPDKFDGASLVVSIPSAAVLEYGSPDSTSKNAVVVAEAGELVVDVQGNVSLPELRDFLLSLPGLPSEVVAQLKQIQNWNDTLPIPVPVNQVNWQSTTIDGSQGLLLNDNSGIGSAAIWHANGHLMGVIGSLKATDLKRIADSLH